MDYDVTTYVDGEVERVIEYKDVPLKNNVEYYGYVPENVYSANILYDLVTEEGDVLSADSDSYEGVHQIFTESISLSNENLKMNVGGKITLSATVLPANTTNGLLYWSSSDDNVAKVDEITGEVEAIAEGTATITVTTLDGLSAECTIEVMSEGGNSGDNNTFIMGDLDKDGLVNLIDATILLRGAVGIITLTDEQKKAADINNEGKINLNDATMVLCAAVGIAK